MWEIRVEAFPPPHRYPASWASTVIDSFQLGSSKGPPGWWAMETELGSEAKESILWLKNGEVGAQALESRLSWRGRAPGCFLGGLGSGGGGRCQVLCCFALSRPQCQAQCLCTRPTASTLELSCHVQRFCTRSWSWGVSSAILEGTLSGLKFWALQLCAGIAHLMC